jgi:hypothetical protein
LYTRLMEKETCVSPASIFHTTRQLNDYQRCICLT